MSGQDKLWDAGVEYDRATKKLSVEQGRVARANARKTMLRVLRKMRTTLDKEYPTIAKTTSRRRKPLKESERFRRLIKRGYVECRAAGGLERKAANAVVKDCAALGIRVYYDAFHTPWVPKWAMAAENKSQMSRARRMKNEREALAGLYMFGQRRK